MKPAPLPMLRCPHRPPCPGCPRLGEPDIDATARGALEALARAAGLGDLRVLRGAQIGFRHRARLAVRGRTVSPKVGIFEAGSHRVVDIPRCLVHHPLVNDVALELRRAIKESGVPVYSDEAHRGLVRYLQVVVERRSTTAQVVVVTAGDTPDGSFPLLAALSARLGDRLHSLHWNGNPERANAILGPLWHRASGPGSVEERIGGARVFYPPGAFGQSHLDLASDLVETIHGWVPSGARVAELYAGVGAIGLGLAERSTELRLNERDPESLRGLDEGVASLPDRVRERVTVVPGSAGAAAGLVPGTDVVIVDPPRRGLDPELRDALARTPPGRLIYVACGLEPFLADAAALTSSGRLRLTELLAFDMFPHTEHVETMALFERT